MSSPSGSSNCGKDQGGLDNTTLFIRPVAGELKRDDILSHFSAFGEVNSVQIRNKPKCSYGFVKFALADSAAKALEVDSHLIAGCRVNVVVASDRHQEKATPLDMSDDATTLSDLIDNKTGFLDLNDHCINEILSMKCLSVNDLCAAAETCRRLKETASRVFKREHKICDIRSLSNQDGKTAKRILMNFGSDISQLKIRQPDVELFSGCLMELDLYYSSRNAEASFFKTLLELDSLKSLPHLTLEFVDINSEFIRAVSQLTGLQVLEFTKCNGLKHLDEIGDLSQLTTLEIQSHKKVDWDIVLLVGRLNKLNSLRVAASDFKMDLETYLRIVDVVRHNPDRSKLTVRLACGEPLKYDDLLTDFARNAHLMEVIVDEVPYIARSKFDSLF